MEHKVNKLIPYLVHDCVKIVEPLKLTEKEERELHKKLIKKFGLSFKIKY